MASTSALLYALPDPCGRARRVSRIFVGTGTAYPWFPGICYLGFMLTGDSTAVPPKVEEAFRVGKYVPYTALSNSERAKAANGEETLVFSSGGLVSKTLDRSTENTISILDWQAAARASEDRTRIHHGARADALAAHHAIVLRLASMHSWEIAVAYDIRQRELFANHPRHDPSRLNNDVLTIITTRLVASRGAQSRSLPYSGGQASPLKRGAPAESSTSPRKRFRSYCFRCGKSGHLPGDCSERTTVTGRGCANVRAGAQGKHTLQAPGGKDFCFRFAKFSSCSFGSACTGFHACSICGDTSHGAAKCGSAN